MSQSTSRSQALFALNGRADEDAPDVRVRTACRSQGSIACDCERRDTLLMKTAGYCSPIPNSDLQDRDGTIRGGATDPLGIRIRGQHVVMVASL